MPTYGTTGARWREMTGTGRGRIGTTTAGEVTTTLDRGDRERRDVGADGRQPPRKSVRGADAGGEE